VKAVLFSVEASLAAICLQGQFAKSFFGYLDARHRPPQNVAYMRMVRLIELAFFREYARLIEDNVLWLGSSFAATNSDFYRNPERRESYGCIVANMSALRYQFEDGRKLFMSKQTLNEGAAKLLVSNVGVLSQCETVIAFKRFEGSHTAAGVGRWLADEHQAKGLLPSYVCFHCTDGAANAVASVSEYELLTEMNRDAKVHHQKCLAHQANRAAKFASGTGDFKVCANKGLADVLTKMHTIVARVHRSGARIAIIREEQFKMKRSRVVLPSPGVTTRWDSTNREVGSLNRIMGDFNKGLHVMMRTIDKDKLTTKEGKNVPVTDYTFTPHDKMILRQFECASEPCVRLSKFFQINDATSHETIFVTRAYIALMKKSSFTMYDDIAHTDLVDLRKRNKTIHVTSSSHEIVGDDGFSRDIPMEPSIELFRQLYASDLEERCGFIDPDDGEDSVQLPSETAIALLLNPLYGGLSDCCVRPCSLLNLHPNLFHILFPSSQVGPESQMPA
jgi:hypothetical protein